MTLKEMIEFLDDGFDICDNIFDFGIYYGYSTDRDKDYYDKALELIASKIEVIKLRKNWYSSCDISSFIKKYQDKIDEFINKTYLEEYTPKYLCKKYDLETIKDDDSLFCEVYLDMFFKDLASGNLSEKRYKEIYDLLKE